MRSFSFSLEGATLAHLVTVTRKDETVIRATSYNEPVTVGAETWSPVGITVGDQTFRNDGALSNMTLTVAIRAGGPFDPYDIDVGAFDDAAVLIEIVNAASPSTKDFEFAGTFNGNIEYDLAGSATFEVLNKFGTPRDIFVRKYTIEDQVDFGDPRRSKIPTFPSVDGSADLADVARAETLAVGDRRRFRFDSAGDPSDYRNVYLEVTAISTGVTAGSAPAFSDTPDDTTVDGGVTFTTRNAWARHAQIDAIVDSRTLVLTALPDPRAADSSWFAPGRLVVRSGALKNRVTATETWDGGTFELGITEPFANLLSPGDWLEVAPDYDQTLEMAAEKYDNANNYRGFPHLVGSRIAAAVVVPGTSPLPGPTDDPVAVADGTAVEFGSGSG